MKPKTFFQLLGGIIFVAGILALVNYLKGENEPYAFLWVCDITGILLGLALLSGKSTLVLPIAIWALLMPFPEFLFDFKNVISKPEYPILVDNFALLVAILFLITQRFFHPRFVLLGLLSVMSYFTLTNFLTGGAVNYPPGNPILYPLWLVVVPLVLFIIFLFWKIKGPRAWLILIVLFFAFFMVLRKQGLPSF